VLCLNIISNKVVGSKLEESKEERWPPQKRKPQTLKLTWVVYTRWLSRRVFENWPLYITSGYYKKTSNQVNW
jgi:hypothetical protein